MSVFLLVVGIILFISLVVIHEWGHFIMARRGGVEVEEFGIFFPPRLFKYKTKGGWNFTINLLPLGGFVKLKGEHDSDTAKGSFGAASLKVKTQIMAAGVVMNLITALVLLTIICAVGLPKLIDNQFSVKSDTHVTSQKVFLSFVEPNSPAAKAGLRSLDQLTEIQEIGRSPVMVAKSADLPALTKLFAGKDVKLYYTRNGKDYVGKTTLLSAATVTKSRTDYAKEVANTKLDCKQITPAKGFLGVEPRDYTVERSTWSAPVRAVGFSAQVTVLTFQGLGHAVGGLGKLIAGTATGNSTARQNGQCAASAQVSGPVGIFEILKTGTNFGFIYILTIIAIISLTLAIMNILPIPALDGGRLWLTLASRALKRPISAKREEMISLIGFMVLMTLIILITIVDVKRFF
jgi:regulator of sigma E protease